MPLSTPPGVSAWQKKLPLWLTFSRIALTPVIVICLLSQQALFGYCASALFILGSLTDWWDGHFARKYQSVTNLGKFLDPIADKIMVSSTLIMMIPSGRVEAILVVLLTARDLVIGGVRSIAAAEQLIIDAKPAGKWKTAIQMVGIPIALIHEPLFGIPLEPIGRVLLWVSVVLSFTSAAEYIREYWRVHNKA